MDFLRYFYEKEGISPTTEDFINNQKYPGFLIYTKYFGSWNKAIIEAGLQTNNSGSKKLYTDEELLECLTHFYEENGRPPSWRDFNNLKYPNHVTYINRFGSWKKSLEIVGLDLDSIVMKGIIGTDDQKSRLAEILVRNHFSKQDRVIDLSGKNHLSPYDGICPNGQRYDVKSSILMIDYWMFNLDNLYKDEIEWYYLLAFNKNHSGLLHAWRIPAWDFIESIENGHLEISITNSRKYNLGNMIQYEITIKFTSSFENYLNKVRKGE